ncbi:uncharacterized protein MONBRDRAFT_22097 [Monosiga brevicollis MX1]|uniref:Uncharacterized protein n=1 Tax=Monosiga brevicollis TaxID=81824 RepID=A9UPJ9_MONBE|nr:uncharacterized protein MONBRDRAFT_22097 [Monosiga brevicollis MX1]EDQ92437.1 predicted protein [Monosiga brevicollis MX1]|eukprot:XP_001742199.1 hypothetical protein [Monosiga brevicollis MX1]
MVMPAVLSVAPNDVALFCCHAVAQFYCRLLGVYRACRAADSVLDLCIRLLKALVREPEKKVTDFDEDTLVLTLSSAGFGGVYYAGFLYAMYDLLHEPCVRGQVKLSRQQFKDICDRVFEQARGSGTVCGLLDDVIEPALFMQRDLLMENQAYDALLRSLRICYFDITSGCLRSEPPLAANPLEPEPVFRALVDMIVTSANTPAFTSFKWPRLLEDVRVFGLDGALCQVYPTFSNLPRQRCALLSPFRRSWLAEGVRETLYGLPIRGNAPYNRMTRATEEQLIQMRHDGELAAHHIRQDFVQWLSQIPTPGPVQS